MSPAGIPNHMYDLPEEYGLEECGKNLLSLDPNLPFHPFTDFFNTLEICYQKNERFEHSTVMQKGPKGLRSVVEQNNLEGPLPSQGFVNQFTVQLLL